MKQTISPRLFAAIALNDLLPYVASGDRFIAISLALMKIDEYLLEAAHLQRRITGGRRAATLALSEGPMDGRRRLKPFPFATIHFYANCWTIIGSHLDVVRDLAGFPVVGRTLRAHNKVFDAYNDVRNHYEHFDERLPGQKRHDRLRDRTDLGNLTDTTLTIGGVRTDVGPSSLGQLRGIISEVKGAFKLAALEKLATERPEDFARVVRRSQTDLQLEQLRRSSEA